MFLLPEQYNICRLFLSLLFSMAVAQLPTCFGLADAPCTFRPTSMQGFIVQSSRLCQHMSCIRQVHAMVCV